jgi:hypothetical protein
MRLGEGAPENGSAAEGSGVADHSCHWIEMALLWSRTDSRFSASILSTELMQGLTLLKPPSESMALNSLL